MNEVHLLLVCPQYAATREHLGLVEVVQDVVQTHGEGEEGYAAYWGKGNSLNVDQLKCHRPSSDLSLDLNSVQKVN